jgi:hypothetical protein
VHLNCAIPALLLAVMMNFEELNFWALRRWH